LNAREERGKRIAKLPNQIRRFDEQEYFVLSQSCAEIEYRLISTELGWLCNCPDARFRKVQCKHEFAVRFSLEVREKVESSIVIEPINVSACPKCNSDSIVKHGIRHNKFGELQRFSCKSCGDRFTINLGFERMKHNPQAITSAMQFYFSGESLRHTQDSLRLLGTQVSYQTIHNWIQKYISLMQNYLDQITPQVSHVWRTDELYLKIRGNMKYLFAMMDDQTRFWIAQQVADHKGTSDVRPMFREAKEIAEKKPKTLISDGAANFHEAYQKEFWTLKGPRTEHIEHIRLQGDVHNN
jgi:transposase-like protein